MLVEGEEGGEGGEREVRTGGAVEGGAEQREEALHGAGEVAGVVEGGCVGGGRAADGAHVADDAAEVLVGGGDEG